MYSKILNATRLIGTAAVILDRNGHVGMRVCPRVWTSAGEDGQRNPWEAIEDSPRTSGPEAAVAATCMAAREVAAGVGNQSDCKLNAAQPQIT